LHDKRDANRPRAQSAIQKERLHADRDEAGWPADVDIAHPACELRRDVDKGDEDRKLDGEIRNAKDERSGAVHMAKNITPGTMS
jgi:hypothetical protein